MTPPVAAETLRYDWHLGGIAGTVARVFVPGKGESTLTTRPVGDGLIETELRITSRDAEAGEYWVYGARVEVESGRPVRAWNESFFRDRKKRREAELAEPDLIDIPSGIHLLRTDPPQAPRRLRLWSDGKVYPVLLQPAREERRRLEGERQVLLRYTILGLDVPGERRWKGELDMWVTPDDRSVPVEIRFRRTGGVVHLQLQ